MTRKLRTAAALQIEKKSHTQGKQLHRWNTKYVPDPKYNGNIPRLEWTCVRCGQKKYAEGEKVPQCSKPAVYPGSAGPGGWGK